MNNTNNFTIFYIPILLSIIISVYNLIKLILYKTVLNNKKQLIESIGFCFPWLLQLFHYYIYGANIIFYISVITLSVALTFYGINFAFIYNNNWHIIVGELVCTSYLLIAVNKTNVNIYIMVICITAILLSFFVRILLVRNKK